MIIRAKLHESKRIYRDMRVSPHVNLQTLAAHVTDAFGFDLDHCYGFFQSPDVYGKAKEAKHYELFYDLGQGADEYAESVVETAVADIFKAVKDKWWMLFDYGDDWIFELECRSIDDEGRFESGTVTKAVGEAPEQYPDFDDDDD